MASTHDRVTMYSDYVCPFCYLGRLSLSTYRSSRDRPLEVEWHPFDLRRHKRGPDGEIDHFVEDGKDEDYFETVAENVAKLRERYGADEMLDLDALPENIDSFDAQAASLYVKREHPGDWEAFDEAIFEALWVEGRDVGDADVLVDLAEAVGLDDEAVRAAIDDESHRDRLREQFADAHERGITGVPTFLADGHAARGAVPPEQLERLIEGG